MKMYRVIANRPFWLNGGCQVFSDSLLTFEQAQDQLNEAWSVDWNTACEHWEDCQDDGTFDDFDDMLSSYAFGRGYYEALYDIESYFDGGDVEPWDVDGEGDYTTVRRFRFAEDGPLQIIPPLSASPDFIL